MSSDICF